MRRTAVIAFALGSLIWGSAGAATAALEAGPVARATSLLSGKRITRFVETGSISVPSSYDQWLHLCTGGRFVLDDVSILPGAGTRVVRTVGRWRVLWASFDRKRAAARVRGIANGRAVVLGIVTDGRRTTAGGSPVIVERSDLCR
jgi:hypothetical protein